MKTEVSQTHYQHFEQYKYVLIYIFNSINKSIHSGSSSMSYFETTSPSSLFLSSLSLSHFSSSIRSSQLLFSTNYNSTLPTTTHLLFLPSLTDFYIHYNHSQPLTFFHQLQISTNTIDRFIAMKRPYVQSYTNSFL